MQTKLKPGQLLVPADHASLIAVPPWTRNDDDDDSEVRDKALLVGRGKLGPNKNARKRARKKSRRGKRRRSRRNKRREQKSVPLASLTPQQMTTVLEIAKAALEALQAKLAQTTVHGERFILEMDIEAAEKRIEQAEQCLADTDQQPNET